MRKKAKLTSACAMSTWYYIEENETLFDESISISAPSTESITLHVVVIHTFPFSDNRPKMCKQAGLLLTQSSDL